MLLRDFAINFGVVSDKARKFSEDIFYYEQRIVSVIPDQKEPAIMTLSEVQRLAQNVCDIFRIIIYLFDQFRPWTLYFDILF